MIRQTAQPAPPSTCFMPVYLPQQPSLANRLRLPYQGLVVCFCAAWCDTCRRYQSDYAVLADAYPQRIFVWADIENHPELLGEADLENFPTLLVTATDTPRFFGPLLPHISHLRRLLEHSNTQADSLTAPPVATLLPDDWLACLSANT